MEDAAGPLCAPGQLQTGGGGSDEDKQAESFRQLQVCPLVAATRAHRGALCASESRAGAHARGAYRGSMFSMQPAWGSSGVSMANDALELEVSSARA